MERFSGLIESTKKEAIIDEERRVSPQVTSVRIGALREQRSVSSKNNTHLTSLCIHKLKRATDVDDTRSRPDSARIIFTSKLYE